MAKRYRSSWWLERKYWDEGLTQQEIAEECGASTRTIRRYMSKYDIPTRDLTGENHPMYGRERSEEAKRKISETLDGRTVSEGTRERMSAAQEGTELSEAVREQISDSLTGITRSEKTRRKMSQSTSGRQNPNWKGGYSRRYGAGWSVVRDRIRERDEVCQHCGHEGTDRRLEVHHIVPVRRFRETPGYSIEAAHCPDNLVLLCRRCHGRADHGAIEFDALDRFASIRES